jgi:hypothetical protein
MAEFLTRAANYPCSTVEIWPDKQAPKFIELLCANIGLDVKSVVESKGIYALERFQEIKRASKAKPILLFWTTNDFIDGAWNPVPWNDDLDARCLTLGRLLLCQPRSLAIVGGTAEMWGIGELYNSHVQRALTIMRREGAFVTDAPDFYRSLLPFRTPDKRHLQSSDDLRHIVTSHIDRCLDFMAAVQRPWEWQAGAIAMPRFKVERTAQLYMGPPVVAPFQMPRYSTIPSPGDLIVPVVTPLREPTGWGVLPDATAAEEALRDLQDTRGGLRPPPPPWPPSAELGAGVSGAALLTTQPGGTGFSSAPLEQPQKLTAPLFVGEAAKGLDKYYIPDFDPDACGTRAEWYPGIDKPDHWGEHVEDFRI